MLRNTAGRPCSRDYFLSWVADVDRTAAFTALVWREQFFVVDSTQKPLMTAVALSMSMSNQPCLPGAA